MEGAGNLYVAVHLGMDQHYLGLIERRDAQGNWSVLATVAPIWVGEAERYYPMSVSLAADISGNLYVAYFDNEDGSTFSRIVKREVEDNWSEIATGQLWPYFLAVDTAGNLYVADAENNRVLKYTPQP